MGILSSVLKWLYSVRNKNLTFEGRARLEPALLARGGEIKIGDNVTIRLGSILMPAGGSIEIGSGTNLNHYCVLHGGNGLKIGSNCLIAPRVSIFAANHNFRDRSINIYRQGMNPAGGVIIEDDVWLGTGVCVVDGVRIGKGAVVGAGSVVTKDIEKYSINVGNPARKIGERE